MSWKKNGVSYLIWFVYAAAVSGLLAGVAGAVCVREGVSAYWGILMAVIVLLASGNLVFLLHRFAERISFFVIKNRKRLCRLEAVLAAAFFVMGIFFRIWEMEDAFRPSVYYEAAKVAEGQRIPQIVHGAVFLYVHLLHTAYLLLGNYFSAGLWVQIILQLAAVLILYLTVRRLFGSAAALTVLLFCTAGPYMITNALVLSPDSLFFLLFTGAAALITMRWRKKLIPVLFLPVGVLAAFCAYVDVTGILLLLPAGAAIFCCRREGSDREGRALAVFFCLLGAVSGFFAACGMDAFLSGKSYMGVLEAWALLYRPEAFRLPVTVDPAGSGGESLFLLAVMTLGIFSYWCDKKEERIRIFVMGAICMIAAACFGILTEEMPGNLFLYLSAVLCAGTGLGQCFALPAAGEDRSPDALREKEEEMEKENDVPERKESESKKVRYIKNPLPLPKKHQKRVLDYPEGNYPEKDDFDYPVSENDDFDI